MGIMRNIWGGRQRGAVAHSSILDALPDRSDVPATPYRGNPYQSYKAQVDATAKKYDGQATWGNQPTRNIVNLRSVFTVGGGLSVQPTGNKEDATREMDWVRDFLTANRLHGRKPFDWARESEIEGKVLIWLFPANPKPQARLLSWRDLGYTVTPDPNDYETYLRVTYKRDHHDVTLEPHEFVYEVFGGRPGQINEPSTRLGACLTYAESMDKAMRDWREINALFASPTPYFECETTAQAEALDKQLKTIQWRIGKVLTVAGAKFALVEYTGGGAESIKQEIARCAAMLSAATGLPLHWIGFPELLSNRATADNLAELVLAATAHERHAWSVVYTELVRKAMAMGAAGRALRPEAVEVVVSEVGAYRMQQVVDVWLPLYAAGAVSIETLLEKVPDVEGASELERLEQDAQRLGLNDVTPQTGQE